MDTPLAAALIALFLWWFSTGAILLRVRAADNAGGDQHLWSCLLSLPLLAAGVGGARLTAADPSATGAVLAFLSAIALWGWIELAFLSGLITGPNRLPSLPGSRGLNRFAQAFLTVAWHELALLAGLLVLAHIAIDAANPFAFWSYAVLFFARISAKLNLFLGVPRIHTEFLPRPLAHLPSHFRRSTVNGFFPVSVSILTLAAFCWAERLWQAEGAGRETGFTLLLALTLLALLEHWFMVLPVPDQKLWRWMLPAPKSLPTPAPKD
jgi:putative photosynthetic complex assembly protein 2